MKNNSTFCKNNTGILITNIDSYQKKKYSFLLIQAICDADFR